MRTLRGWWKRLRAWVADGNRDRDLGEELESVVQMHMDEYLRAGMTQEEARRRALIEVGGVEQVRQAVRDGRAFAMARRMLARDAKYAIRASAADAWIQRGGDRGDGDRHWGERRFVYCGAIRAAAPLPFPHSDRLVALYSQDDRSNQI